MSTGRSKSSESKTLSQFDRGSIQILNHFSRLNESEIITIQLLFFSLLEILSLKLTDNDPIKSNHLFQLSLHFLQTSKIIPTSMILSAKSIRQLKTFQNYVRYLQDSMQIALNIIQKPSSSDRSTITTVLEKDYTKILLKQQTPSNISIDIPQVDIQLKVPLSLTMNGTISTNDFDNIVVFRYVQDFYELDKLGKGAFGSVFRARNRLDNCIYAIKKIVFNENTDRTRHQAKCALHEVRVLASLSHPNIVQYHCAWIELVPIETNSSLEIKKPIEKLKEEDSLDELIEFKEQSLSKKQITSDSENSIFDTNDEDLSIKSTKELIPLQNLNPTIQSIFIHSKIVLFIQMQLCDTTLYDWLRYRDHKIINEISNTEKNSLSHLDQQQCRNIFKQLLTAVEYLHSQSFVHRDIKPRNIFLAYDSKNSSFLHVKLGDFGLTTLFDSNRIPNSPEKFRNDESNGVGTALYAPPEQLNSNHCIATFKSDSYSLGIVLYELFNIFSTEMERHYRLSNLRINMKVDEEFSKYYPIETDIIERLISIERDKRPNIDELLEIYRKENQKKLNKKQNTIEQLEETLRNRDKRIQQLELELEKNKL